MRSSYEDGLPWANCPAPAIFRSMSLRGMVLRSLSSWAETKESIRCHFDANGLCIKCVTFFCYRCNAYEFCNDFPQYKSNTTFWKSRKSGDLAQTLTVKNSVMLWSLLSTNFWRLQSNWFRFEGSVDKLAAAAQAPFLHCRYYDRLGCFEFPQTISEFPIDFKFLKRSY